MKSKIIGLILLLGLSVFMIGCSSESKPSTEKPLTKAEALLKYKNTLVGDNSNIGGILNQLPTSKYGDGFKLKTDSEPYELTINFKPGDKNKEEYLSLWNGKDITSTIDSNSIALFALVDNLDVINYNVKDADVSSYRVTREEIESKYGKDLISQIK
ncbi:MAG: DUF4825 domain-containing protein [Clostridium sp.]